MLISDEKEISYQEQLENIQKANLQKASRWSWRDADRILANGDDVNPTAMHVTRAQLGKWSKAWLQARPGRGRKRADWVAWLSAELVRNFIITSKLL